MSTLQLVIKQRVHPGNYGYSYRFSVEEREREYEGQPLDDMEVANLFTIPAEMTWNESFKRDIIQSIKYALKEAFEWEQIEDLQKQAWEQMEGISNDHHPANKEGVAIDAEERMRIIERHEDGSFTIRLTGMGVQEQSLTLSTEELLELSSDLTAWRWRLTGDSYDPIAAARIREESRNLVP